MTEELNFNENLQDGMGQDEIAVDGGDNTINDDDDDDIKEGIKFLKKGPLPYNESFNHVASVEICEQTVNPNIRVNVEDFNILKVLGQGGYGKVFLVRKVTGEHHKNKLFAMKVLKKAKIIRSEKDTAHTKSERSILENLRHPFLVKLYYAFQNHANLYIVLEYCPGGELFSYLEREGSLLENAACFYVSEITLAIGHLHSLGVIYRDLKPENILLDLKGHVKLTDFGLSKESVNATHTFCGTIDYMAPEILKREGHGKEVDWWSLGALCFDIISGGPPFSLEQKKEVTIKNILKGKLIFPQYFSPEVKSLIKSLLKRNPCERLGYGRKDVEAVKQHAFFKENNIDWDLLIQKALEPPFKPNLKSDLDLSLFDPTFTRQVPEITPPESTPVPNDLFQGFSYVSSSVTESVLKDSGYEPKTWLRTFKPTLEDCHSEEDHSTHSNNGGLYPDNHSPCSISPMSSTAAIDVKNAKFALNPKAKKCHSQPNFHAKNVATQNESLHQSAGNDISKMGVNKTADNVHTSAYNKKSKADRKKGSDGRCSIM